MRMIALAAPDDFEGWRANAKQALIDGLAPSDIKFQVAGDTGSLFDEDIVPSNNRSSVVPVVPKAFMELARVVVCHRDPSRFDLLYSLLVRLQAQKTLLNHTTDPEIHRVNRLAKEIRRDRHKMKAFVRFRKVGEMEGGMEQFVAWFEPSHFIVRLAVPFFVRRFAGMQWSILTPDACAHWDGQGVSFSVGVSKDQAPDDDALEDYWRSYFAAIFNPARLKVQAMQSEMPKKYWKNLPEASLISSLINEAHVREREMVESDPTIPLPSMMKHREVANQEQIMEVSKITDMIQLSQCLRQCRACMLWQSATQVVPGIGNRSAKLMIVGEQPGDREDLEGAPFIGPAGQLLHSIMQDANIKMDDVYITNAVKHFKFAPRGKKRIHQNPSVAEIDACSSWLQKEIDLVKPKVIVALGASAVRGIIGRTARVSKMRGHAHKLKEDCQLWVTNHPSALLRMEDDNTRRFAQFSFMNDIMQAAQAAGLLELGVQMGTLAEETDFSQE